MEPSASIVGSVTLQWHDCTLTGKLSLRKSGNFAKKHCIQDTSVHRLDLRAWPETLYRHLPPRDLRSKMAHSWSHGICTNGEEGKLAVCFVGAFQWMGSRVFSARQ